MLKKSTEFLGLVNNNYYIRRLILMNAPLYNLKKFTDIDRNSLFYKRFWEKFQDSVTDIIAERII